MFNVNDMPEDVAWVWGIQMGKMPVGIETWLEMSAIIKANPTYFPWETKYNSIPQSVHDAYHNERDAGINEYWKKTFDTKGEESFIGIIPAIQRKASIQSADIPQKSWKEIFQGLLKMEQDKKKDEVATLKKNKALWDKYYEPYGLEYK